MRIPGLLAVVLTFGSAAALRADDDPWEPFPDEEALLAALGVKRSEFPVELYDNGAQHVYVALGSEDEVAALRPSLGALGLPEALGTNCFAGAGRTPATLSPAAAPAVVCRNLRRDSPRWTVITLL